MKKCRWRIHLLQNAVCIEASN